MDFIAQDSLPGVQLGGPDWTQPGHMALPREQAEFTGEEDLQMGCQPKWKADSKRGLAQVPDYLETTAPEDAALHAAAPDHCALAAPDLER